VLPALLAPLAADLSRCAVVVDFDGTISPIVADPAAARPVPRARDALARLAGRAYRVTVISARPVAFLRDALGVEGVHLVGQYGAERLVGGAPMIDERMLPYVAALEAAAQEAEAALPGLLIERKGLGVTLHWRPAPGREAEALAAGRRLAAAYGLEAATGRMAMELRPPVAVDKGAAVELEVDGAAYAVCVGDDRSDLAMFDALDRLVRDGSLTRAVRVAVRSAEGPPELVARADVVVDDPHAVAELLDELSAGG
jgi:trehalose 6-phosphate phosphatase